MPLVNDTGNNLAHSVWEVSSAKLPDRVFLVLTTSQVV